jgi:hypothetical protein
MMSLGGRPEKPYVVVASAFILIAAIWLVSPFIKIDASDFVNSGRNALRLAIGLTILIIYLGKWAFDVLAPQGLAKKASGAKAVGLLVLNILLLGFLVFIIVRAMGVYFQTSLQQDQTNF